MFDKLIVARNGGLELSQPDIDLDKAANMFVQAEIYEEEGQKLEEEANKIVEEAQTFGPEILELTEKIKELEASLAPWEWVGEFFDPTFGDRLALQEAQVYVRETHEYVHLHRSRVALSQSLPLSLPLPLPPSTYDSHHSLLLIRPG